MKGRSMYGTTDLPVLLPVKRLHGAATPAPFRLRARHDLWLAAFCLVSAG